MDKTALTTTLLLLFIPAASHATIYKAGPDSDDCAVYEQHVPDADVAYQPGVDAKGWAVDDADLNPPQFGANTFNPVDIPLDIPVDDYIDPNKYNFNSRQTFVWAGKVRVAQDGRFELNGQEVTQQPYLNPDCVKKAE